MRRFPTTRGPFCARRRSSARPTSSSHRDRRARRHCRRRAACRRHRWPARCSSTRSSRHWIPGRARASALAAAALARGGGPWQQGPRRAGQHPRLRRDAIDMLKVLDGRRPQVVSELVRGQPRQSSARWQGRADGCATSSSTPATLRATARQQQALAETFQDRPDLPRRRKGHHQRLESFSKDAELARARSYDPVAPDLTPTLRDVRRLPPSSLGSSPTSTRSSRRPRPDCPPSATCSDRLSRCSACCSRLEQLDPVLDYLEYQQRIIADFISNGAGVAPPTPRRYQPGEGATTCASSPLGPETSPCTRSPGGLARQRLPAPDALTGEQRDRNMMFGNFDCKNAGGERMTTGARTRATTPRASCRLRRRGRRGNTNLLPAHNADELFQAHERFLASALGHDGRRRGVDVDGVGRRRARCRRAAPTSSAVPASRNRPNNAARRAPAGPVLVSARRPRRSSSKRVRAGEVEGDVGSGPGERRRRAPASSASR